MSIRTVNISFQDGLLQEIDRVAKQESRSRSELLREASRMYIERRERWAQIFESGRDIARKRGLKPEIVEQEIHARRRTRRS